MYIEVKYLGQTAHLQEDSPAYTRTPTLVQPTNCVFVMFSSEAEDHHLCTGRSVKSHADTFEVEGYADALRARAAPERVELQLRPRRRRRRRGHHSGDLLSEIKEEVAMVSCYNYKQSTLRSGGQAEEVGGS